MLERLKTIEYDIYLMALGTLSFLSYLGILDKILLPLFIVIALVMIFLKKSSLYLIPIPVFIQMSFSLLRDDVSVTTTYSIIFLVILIIDVIVNRKLKKLGKLFIPLAIMVGLSILSGINAPDLFTAFAGFSQLASVLLIYVYFVNAIEDDKDNLINISKLFLYASMFVTFEMLHFAVTHELEFMDVIRRRIIDLGWENLNIIIYSNVLSIPLAGYLVLKSKYKVTYMIFAMISIIGILMTLSRSSILTLGVFAILIVPYIFYKENGHKATLIHGVGFLVLTALVFLFFEQQGIITGYIDVLFDRDLLKFNDRLELLEIALEQFKLHPIIGSGGLYSSRVYLEPTGAMNYHNTIAQASTLGILGLLGLAYLFFEKTKLILSKKSDFKWVLLVLIYVTAFVNGSLQPMYFYTTYMAFIFMILATYENIEETHE